MTFFIDGCEKIKISIYYDGDMYLCVFEYTIIVIFFFVI